jgi:hypothetical protein
MSKIVVPVNHGLFIDSINYEKLIEMTSSTLVRNERGSLQVSMPKEKMKKKVYGRKRKMLEK